MSNEQKSAMQRRTIIRGAAWAAPSLAVAMAVPAMAASQQCKWYTYDFHPTADNSAQYFKIPSHITEVHYHIRGAGGGGATSVVGQGAQNSGKIAMGSSSGRDWWITVGHGGKTTTNGTTALGGKGFGNGGNSTPGPRDTNVSPSGGGGGGSCISMGPMALVIAGGGGGSGVSHTLQGSTHVNYTFVEPAHGFPFGRASAGGSRNGRGMGVGAVTTENPGFVVSPAAGANGNTGGVGGGGTYWAANGNWTYATRSGGQTGGSSGTGQHGGGNGGNGAPRMSNQVAGGPAGSMSATGGGGGGGYAGGGGGGLAGAIFKTDQRRSISGGSGAAGSNFVIDHGVTSEGWKNSGMGVGHDGYVQLSWCDPIFNK